MAHTKKLMLALVFLTVVVLSQGAPSSRRSRDAKLAVDDDSDRQSKLTTDFKNEPSTTQAPASKSSRKNKALNFLGFFPSFLSSGLDYSEDDEDDVTFAVNDDNFDDDDLSRTIPTRRKQQNKKKNGPNPNYPNDEINSLQYDNSPIFYIRLPPTPYMFVPGLGYVSQPPSLGPPMGPMSPAIPPQVPDPFINLPLDFVSNGKPTGVYQWPDAPGYPQVPVDPYGFGAPSPPVNANPNYNNSPSYSKPKPKPSSQSNSKITNLKGPYVFNGKPNDNVYVLRDTYNSIYSDALQNFYP